MDRFNKIFIINNGFSAFGLNLIDMTLLWILYLALKNPILYIPVASAKPIGTLLLSSFTGYIADKYDRKKLFAITGTIHRILPIFIVYFVIISFNPILAVILYVVRTGLTIVTTNTITPSFIQNLPEDKMKKVMFYNRAVKESSTILSIVIWPLFYAFYSGWTVIPGIILATIGFALIFTLPLGGKGGKKVKFREALKEYRRKEIFFISMTTAVSQGALGMVYLYSAAIIQILHGNTIQYTLAQLGFYLSWLIGPWMMTKFNNVTKLVVTSFAMYFLVFIVLALKNPWLIGLSTGSVGIGDSLTEIIWIKAMRMARQELMASVLGIDEFITAGFRLGYGSIAGTLYATDFFAVPIIGVITIAGVALAYTKNDVWKMKI
ncbi:hypothetical protein Ahos_0449 [Acidianus hospitalis W1]|uniref:MFS transporter n=1 Tax=Acidianus hospitalis (strain W1) TaxID=933801 RepID=F4B649_ACIHW|nr:hypothetical protein [Acidianus hospitalis]AEE93337.1 hypothetical protein Ahos_0449 [Acidianus hospitalis W1]